jgi:hypothetical protein
MTTKQNSGYQRWTLNEDEQLASLIAKKFKIEKIAEQMKRTTNSIYVRKTKIADLIEKKIEDEKVRNRSSRWTPVQDRELKSMDEKGFSNEEIAIELGRTTHSIACRKNFLKTSSASTRAEAVEPIKTEETVSEKIRIPSRSVGLFIGKNGENIKKLINDHRVHVSVFEEIATVTGTSKDVKAAMTEITEWIAAPKIGQIYEAKIIGTQSFGTFFSLTPLFQGLLHFTKYTKPFTKGETAWVKVSTINDEGKIQLELSEKPAPVINIDEDVKKFTEMLTAKTGKKVSVHVTF